MLGVGFGLSKIASAASLPAIFGGGPPFSLKLDGTDDFMVVDDDSSITPTAALTLSAWVNLDTQHGATGWLNPDGSPSEHHSQAVIGCVNVGGWGIFIEYHGTANNPTTKIKSLIRVTDTGSGSGGYLTPIWGGKTSSTAGSALHEIKDFSGWIHIAVTYASGVARLYINGSNDLNVGAVDTSAAQTVDSGVTDNPIVYRSNTALMIGADAIAAGNNSSANTHLKGGLIDDVAVWDAAIDSDGITVIYNSGKAGLNLLAASGNYDNQNDLQAWWKFEEGSGTSVADSSSNSNTGTLVNSPSFSDNTSE
tara:strand:- start:149 stop:1072 length:924 start_codon:yes stop_codon:yes gene_type:complete